MEVLWEGVKCGLSLSGKGGMVVFRWNEGGEGEAVRLQTTLAH